MTNASTPRSTIQFNAGGSTQVPYLCKVFILVFIIDRISISYGFTKETIIMNILTYYINVDNLDPKFTLYYNYHVMKYFNEICKYL